LACRSSSSGLSATNIPDLAYLGAISEDAKQCKDEGKVWPPYKQCSVLYGDRRPDGQAIVLPESVGRPSMSKRRRTESEEDPGTVTWSNPDQEVSHILGLGQNAMVL
jgi:hypothetical protein